MKKVQDVPACPLTRNESFGNVSPFSAQDLINIENLKKKRRKISVSRGKTGRGVLSGPLYIILRLPVMFFVGFFVAFELCAYVVIRLIIWVFECSTVVVDRKSARILREMTFTTSLNEYLQLAMKLDKLLKKPSGSVPLQVLELSRQLAKARQEIGNIEKKKISTPVKTTTQTENSRTPHAVREIMKREIDSYPTWMKSTFAGESSSSNESKEKDETTTKRHVRFQNEDEETWQSSKKRVELLALLRALCTPNHSGIDDELYFSRSYTGRNLEAEACAENTAKALRYFARVENYFEDEHAKLKLFEELQDSFGFAALCLSGGAANGYYHLGVAKALIRHKLLPRVISGSSAGAVVAAALCCARDSELHQFTTPDMYVRCTPCSDSLFACLKRYWNKGHFYSTEHWRACAMGMLGSDPNITFLEAYKRTGRVLCISVFNGQSHSQILNYVTAPNVCIFSAVVASAAIPKLLPPQTLLQKLSDGTVVPYRKLGDRWIDGSFEGDIPISELQKSFNVKYTIVSQVQPHLSCFYFFHSGQAGHPTSHRNGLGWRSGFVCSFLEHSLKTDMKRWIRILHDFDLIPRFFGHDLSTAFLQDELGTVTVLPSLGLWDFTRLFKDPGSRKIMKYYLDSGARQTWPKLHMIRCRSIIERELMKGVRMIRRNLDKRGEEEKGVMEDVFNF